MAVWYFAGELAARVKSLLGRAADELARYRYVLICLLLLQIVAYTYFFFSMIFTDHTFPNSWLYGYPSFKTWGEGRWLADLIIMMQGGSGVQSLQMICAAVIQGLNGILLARLIGLSDKFQVFIIAAILCLYPAFLDYYSFVADHISFVIGDFLVLLGSLAWVRRRRVIARLAWTSFFYSLALATYAPKIALISTFTLFNPMLILTVYSASFWNKEYFDGSRVVREFLLAPAPLVAAVALFWASTKILIRRPIFPSTHLNSAQEVVKEIGSSYGAFWSYLSSGIGGVPSGILGLIPLLLVMCGLFSLMTWPGRNRLVRILLFGTVLLVPVAVNSSRIVNHFTPSDSGRFYAAYAYTFLFFLGIALQHQALRQATLAMACLLLWFFLVLGTQQSNAAQFKSTYELSMINRILGRVEPLLRSSETDQNPLVVIGNYPRFDVQRFVHWPSSRDAPHMLTTEVFASYRQVEIMNFLLGKNMLRQPTEEEKRAALKSAEGVSPWPAEGSVFLSEKSVVVALQHHRQDGPITWSLTR